MDLKVVLYEKRDGIAVVTMNYPQRLNALSDQLRKDLMLAYEEALNDKEIKAVVLTGTDRAFCAGADISGFQFDMPYVRKFMRDVMHFLAYLEKYPKPVIASVNGLALGGGLEIAISSDIIIASDKARFGVPEAAIGLAPGFAIIRLHQIVGRAKSKELAMTCDQISANEALKIGLINKVVPHEELMDASMEMAKKIMSKAPLAIELIKSSINRDLHGEELTYAMDAMAGLFRTDDAKEGIDAFLSKREPEFKGL
ncbi:MAG: enoyl-CoA hydratase/isomerase family protein [Thermodesulfobacteriota bacterium]|nr:enoyl-CoA hydratase/isomerase family protein [Thermodesulfobacteriota bacterium]